MASRTDLVFTLLSRGPDIRMDNRSHHPSTILPLVPQYHLTTLHLQLTRPTPNTFTLPLPFPRTSPLPPRPSYPPPPTAHLPLRVDLRIQRPPLLHLLPPNALLRRRVVQGPPRPGPGTKKEGGWGTGVLCQLLGSLVGWVGRREEGSGVGGVGEGEGRGESVCGDERGMRRRRSG